MVKKINVKYWGCEGIAVFCKKLVDLWIPCPKLKQYDCERKKLLLWEKGWGKFMTSGYLQLDVLGQQKWQGTEFWRKTVRNGGFSCVFCNSCSSVIFEEWKEVISRVSLLL